MNDSSEPVETSSTRTPSHGPLPQRAGQLEHARRRRTGCRWRRARRGARAMSANAAAEREREERAEPPQRPQARSARRAPPAPGPAATSSITCGEVSWRSYQSGNASAGHRRRAAGRTPARRARRRGGRRTRSCARRRGRRPRRRRCRSCRCGSSRRKTCGPPETSSAIPAAAAAPDRGGQRARPRARRARRPGPASAGGRGHQPERDPVGAVRALLLDPGVSTRTIQPLADPLGGPALAVGGRRALDRGEVLDGGPQALAMDSGMRRGRLPCRAWPPIPTASSARSSRGRSPPRASPRTTARSPSWTSTRPRAGTCSSIPREHAKDLLAIDPEDLAAVAQAAQRIAVDDARAPRRRRRQPPQLVRPRGLADRLPLPRARDPALRRRPAAAAVDARARATATRSPRRRATSRAERARGSPPRVLALALLPAAAAHGAGRGDRADLPARPQEATSAARSTSSAWR